MRIKLLFFLFVVFLINKERHSSIEKFIGKKSSMDEKISKKNHFVGKSS